jgi:hypothetical protein
MKFLSFVLWLSLDLSFAESFHTKGSKGKRDKRTKYIYKREINKSIIIYTKKNKV